MPIVCVSSMITALRGIAGAISPAPGPFRKPIDQFEITQIVIPVTDDLTSSESDDSVLIERTLHTRLSNDELEQAIRRSAVVRGPWGSTEEEGTDALAWYVSFHRDPTNWGIYIPVTGLLRFAHHLVPAGALPQQAWEDVLRLAMRALLAHERMHYGIDYAAGQIELLFDTPCYVPSRASLSRGGYIPDEEQLANGACLRSIKWAPADLRIPGAFSAAVEFSRTQPPGYRDGFNCIQTTELLAFANEYVKRMASALPTPRSPVVSHPIDYTNFIPFGPLVEYRNRPSRMASINASQCPVYLILDGAIVDITPDALKYIAAIPAIAESPRFAKQLQKLGMQNDWAQVKSILADPLAPRKALDFKRWPPEDQPGVTAFSVRVGRGNTNIRAHLYLDKSNGNWSAASIGNSDQQGHH